MTEDASLTDFQDGDGRADDAVTNDDTANDNPADDAPSEDDPVDDAESDGTGDSNAVYSVRSTYAWGDYACADCGASIDRAWRDGEAFVCGSCKKW